MNWTDYIILGIVSVSVLVGLWRGLVSEVLALVIWVGSIWFAWMFGPTVAAYFDRLIHTPALRLVAGYAACLVGALVVGALVKALVNRLMIGSGLSGTDRMLGLLFGFARGVLLVALMVFLLGFTAATHEPWWRKSLLLPQFQSVAVALSEQLPESTARYLKPSPEVLDKLHKLPEMPKAPELRSLPEVNSVSYGKDVQPALNKLGQALHGGAMAPRSSPAPSASAAAADHPLL